LKLSVTAATSAKDPKEDGTYSDQERRHPLRQEPEVQRLEVPYLHPADRRDLSREVPVGLEGRHRLRQGDDRRAADQGQPDDRIGTLKSDTGKFAKKLSVPIPAKLLSPLGLRITLTRASTP